MNKEDTRVLGIGEVVRWGDYISIGDDMIPVGREHAGHLVDGDEGFDVRRALFVGHEESWPQASDKLREQLEAVGIDPFRNPPFSAAAEADPAKWAPPTKALTHDDGKPPLAELPWKALRQVARVMAYGSRKYEKGNWRRGLEISRNLSCSMRHIADYLDGQDLDSESGVNHLAHAATRLLFVLENIETNKAIDDRYKA